MTPDRITIDRAHYRNLHEALERERRLVDALLRPFVLADCILDDPTIRDAVKLDLLASHHRRAKQLEALVMSSRIERKAS